MSAVCGEWGSGIPWKWIEILLKPQLITSLTLRLEYFLLYTTVPLSEHYLFSLSSLSSVSQLEELCSGEMLDTAEQEELLETQGESLSGKMKQPNSDNHSECSRSADAAHLHAAHLLVSAMEGER